MRGVYVRKKDALDAVIPARNPKVIGNLEVYYYDYDYLKDHLGSVPPITLEGTMAYEALNLVDGRRSITEIRNVLRAAYGPISPADLLDYFKVLEKAAVLTILPPSRSLQ